MRIPKLLARLMVALAVGLVSVVALTPQQAAADAPKPAQSATQMYTTSGQWTFNNRTWHTFCSKYSSTVERCQTNIWATTVEYKNGKFEQKWAWTFNNLTYKTSPRSTWEEWNVLVTPGEHTSNGRKWKTECNTAWTGQNACRSQIWSTIPVLKDGRFQHVSQWVFNNIVHLTPVPCPISEKYLADALKESAVIQSCLRSKIDANWLAVEYPDTYEGDLYMATAFFEKKPAGWALYAKGGLNVGAICDAYEKGLPHAHDLADTISYCHVG